MGIIRMRMSMGNVSNPAGIIAMLLQSGFPLEACIGNTPVLINVINCRVQFQVIKSTSWINKWHITWIDVWKPIRAV